MADTILAIKVRESTDLDFFAYSLMQQIIFLASLKKKKKKKAYTKNTFKQKSTRKHSQFHSPIPHFILLYIFCSSLVLTSTVSCNVLH